MTVSPITARLAQCRRTLATLPATTAPEVTEVTNE
jgi:hypothetical protein